MKKLFEEGGFIILMAPIGYAITIMLFAIVGY